MTQAPSSTNHLPTRQKATNTTHSWCSQVIMHLLRVSCITTLLLGTIHANHPCCNWDCEEDCISYMIPPGCKEPTLAWLRNSGIEPGAPCCGTICSTEQCLDLVLKEALAIRAPLQTQLDNHEAVPPEKRCCGKGCSDAQCLYDVWYTFVRLQNALKLTLGEKGDPCDRKGPGVQAREDESGRFSNEL